MDNRKKKQFWYNSPFKVSRFSSENGFTAKKYDEKNIKIYITK
jgi:hypothetical protein